MSNVKWIKLSTSMFDDDKIRLIKAMPKGDTYISVWVELLCFAGRQNNGGIFLMGGKAYTSEMLATVLNRTPKTVKEAIRVFTDYEMLTVEDGVMALTNWTKHQNLEELKEERSDRNEYMREYMRQRRQNVSNSVNNVNVNRVNNVSNVNTVEEEREEELEIELRDRESERNIYIPPLVNAKNVYGKFVNVFLSDDEIQKLKENFSDWEKRIEKLSLYLASSGKAYSSHYATILKWAEEDASAAPQEKRKTNFNNFGGDDGMDDFEKKTLFARVNGK